MPYFYAHYNGSRISGEQYAHLNDDYACERDVRLILLVRYEGNRTIARIKCPINPRPVKGEFDVASMHSLFAFMYQNGWIHKETYNLSMFQWGK